MKTSTPLMDLRREAGQISEAGWKRVRAAQQAFGDLNGWKQEQFFTPDYLGRPHAEECLRLRCYKVKERLCFDFNGVQFRWDEKWISWMGVMLYFREAAPDGRYIAIVGQPFNHPIMRQPFETLTLAQFRKNLDACAEQYGLAWHVPPMPYANIGHCPGETLFIVLTPPDIKVKWLPEQIHETKFRNYNPHRPS
jgi:hypothetical protein